MHTVRDQNCFLFHTPRDANWFVLRWG
jgi:hypothetical protein